MISRANISFSLFHLPFTKAARLEDINLSRVVLVCHQEVLPSPYGKHFVKHIGLKSAKFIAFGFVDTNAINVVFHSYWQIYGFKLPWKSIGAEPLCSWIQYEFIIEKPFGSLSLSRLKSKRWRFLGGVSPQGHGNGVNSTLGKVGLHLSLEIALSSLYLIRVAIRCASF